MLLVYYPNYIEKQLNLMICDRKKIKLNILHQDFSILFIICHTLSVLYL